MFQDGQLFNHPRIGLAESSWHIPWIPAKNMPEWRVRAAIRSEWLVKLLISTSGGYRTTRWGFLAGITAALRLRLFMLL
jgi:hypothetical protein